MLAELGLPRITNETIVDVDALLSEIAEVRRKGWARQREEIHEGISGFAAPVHDADGRLLAALVVMGPTGRIDEQAESIVDALVAEARALSAEVGVVDSDGTPIAPT
jgi:DNA-binding IclR family transcriptional regulator